MNSFSLARAQGGIAQRIPPLSSANCAAQSDALPRPAFALFQRRGDAFQNEVHAPGLRDLLLVHCVPVSEGDLPVRLSCKRRVQPLFEKFPASRFTQISFITPPSTPLEGRIAIVTDAGLDAMDAAALLTNSAKADGEVVWS